MKIQSSVLVHLGFGKYVRSDRVTAVVPIEADRGPGRRTFVQIEGQAEPIVASRAEDSIIHGRPSGSSARRWPLACRARAWRCAR